MRTKLHWSVKKSQAFDNDLRLTDGRNSMSRNPNNKDGNVNKSDGNGGSPFQLKDSRPMFGDDGDSVDDNLHKKLDLKDPKEKNKEQHGYTIHC